METDSKKRGRGRPKILESNPEGIKRFLQAMAQGNYFETSAKFSGIGKSTLYQLIEIADGILRSESEPSKAQFEREQPYVDFSDAFSKAVAEAEMRHVQSVNELSKPTELKTETEVYSIENGASTLKEKRVEKKEVRGSAMTSRWFLERRYPDKYGSKAKLDINAKIEHMIHIPEFISLIMPSMRRNGVIHDVPKQFWIDFRLDMMRLFDLSESDIRDAQAIQIEPPEEPEESETEADASRSERESNSDGGGDRPEGGGGYSDPVSGD